MRLFIKTVYRLKIHAIFYFNLGWNEIATPIAAVKDIGLILTVLSLLFKINFGAKADALICLATFCIAISLGLILKFSGMSDYANKLTNSINPEMKLINRIADKLNLPPE